MDVLINELSLDGQFNNQNEFLDNLETILVSIKLLESLHINLLKNYMFYSSSITSEYMFSDIVKSKDDRVRKLKSFLLKLSNNPPYWNDSQVHSCENDEYIYNSKNICETSLAESSQRDKVVLSFKHNYFLDEELEIQKNESDINLYNIINNHDFLNYLLFRSKINPLIFCLNRYKKSNLDFTLLEVGYGFDILNGTQTKEYLTSFFEFSKMSWEDISQSDGLEYKQYNKPKKLKVKGWFRRGLYANIDIYKFRVTQEYRCFGYRKEDIFYVLRFEIDHEISDKG